MHVFFLFPIIAIALPLKAIFGLSLYIIEIRVKVQKNLKIVANSSYLNYYNIIIKFFTFKRWYLSMKIKLYHWIINLINMLKCIFRQFITLSAVTIFFINTFYIPSILHVLLINSFSLIFID
uniref:7TM_GPCR_Srx domain-containing protein n=1 Tax=Parastrongyloides trichosuri TaxID=131310 RepID=A0A0N4ZY86_PARTI